MSPVSSHQTHMWFPHLSTWGAVMLSITEHSLRFGLWITLTPPAGTPRDKELILYIRLHYKSGSLESFLR